MKKVKQNKKLIYLDHAATTPLDPRVERAMRPFWSKNFGNPSSICRLGVDARKAVEDARKSVANVLHCSAAEIIFTPGGTASDNLAVLGVAHAVCALPSPPPFSNSRELENGGVRQKKRDQARGHIIVSSIEHEAVLEPAWRLEKEGFSVTLLKVDKNGLVNPMDVKKSLRPDTVLVSVMYANNEIGTIQPIREIAKVVRDFRKTLNLKLATFNSAVLPLLHTDACQAANYLELNVQKLGVDLMTLNGSKIYGPKMSGMLFVKSGVKLTPIMLGGGQERGLWSGTENVPGIIGFAKALEISEKLKGKEIERLTKLRDYFIGKLQSELKNVTLNGDPVRRLPNNVHVSINGVEGEVMVLYLDAEHIQAAVGSACTSQSMEPSHVLKAIGLSSHKASGSLRLTLGRSTTKADCDHVVEAMQGVVALLRK